MGCIVSSFFLEHLFAIRTLQRPDLHQRSRIVLFQFLPDGFFAITGFTFECGNTKITRPHIGIIEEKRAFAILKLIPVRRIVHRKPCSGRDKFLALHSFSTFDYLAKIRIIFLSAVFSCVLLWRFPKTYSSTFRNEYLLRSPYTFYWHTALISRKSAMTSRSVICLPS